MGLIPSWKTTRVRARWASSALRSPWTTTWTSGCKARWTGCSCRKHHPGSTHQDKLVPPCCRENARSCAKVCSLLRRTAPPGREWSESRLGLAGSLKTVEVLAGTPWRSHRAPFWTASWLSARWRRGLLLVSKGTDLAHSNLSHTDRPSSTTSSNHNNFKTLKPSENPQFREGYKLSRRAKTSFWQLQVLVSWLRNGEGKRIFKSSCN